ncbi:MAG: hypothetical protein C3F13_03205 [Anaerolineales bacterium]|nr:MAG: hypothetical protein C3F13_03205 [Anaerolineales bacterium]
MYRFTLVLSFILLILLGVGCSRLQETTVPTPLPLDYIPTAVQLTLQAAQTDTPDDIPTSTSTPTNIPFAFPTIPQLDSPTPGGPLPTSPANNQTVTLSPTPSATATSNPNATATPRPSRAPSLTPTPTLPPAGVQINSPGPMSRVASPLKLTANLRAVASGSYNVELWIEPLQPGGDPRLLYREVERLISNPVEWLYLDQHIEFELDRVSEYGQLRITVLDSFGRAVSINSINVILLQLGQSSLTPAGLKTESLVINEPTPNHLIQGGVLIVSGIALPTEDFIHAQLVTADGRTVGSADYAVIPSSDGSYVPYSVEVPYQVEIPTWVRLQVSESSSRIAGIDHLSSVQVLLSP